MQHQNSLSNCIWAVNNGICARCANVLAVWSASLDSDGYCPFLQTTVRLLLLFPENVSWSCVHPVFVSSLIPFSFSPPQAVQPHTEKACCSQGTWQRAELPVYSCQNTGGLVCLPLVMLHVLATQLWLFFGTLHLPDHRAETMIRHAANLTDWYKNMLSYTLWHHRCC